MSTRLLSPMRKRIYPNARTGASISESSTITRKQRDGRGVGEADPVTWGALVKLGWVEYDGPGRTDARGYVIPGTLEPS